MLQTLLKLGQQVSKNRGEWDDILDFPAVDTETKKGEALTNYCLSIQFDLDNGTVGVGNLVEYDANSPREWFNVAIQGGNNKSVYVCVDGRKSLEQLRKTFFGKPEDAKATTGEFVVAIENAYPALKSTQLFDVLTRIYALRGIFESQYVEKGKVELRKLTEGVLHRTTDRVVLVYAAVRCSELGISEFTPFGSMIDGDFIGVEGYQTFLLSKYKKGNSASSKSDPTKLCYATGELQPEVEELAITERYSLNKMFVTTTVNYASGFDGGRFSSNYQVGNEAQLLLERGSRFLLERYKTRIAGVDHCLVPQLPSQTTESVESKLARLNRKADLLFQYREVTKSLERIEEDDPDVYWITFLGFESDGNFFKTINLIRDVSQTYFSKLVRAFTTLNNDWHQAPELPWGQVMGKLEFNLHSVYGLIPVRKDKEKRNAALLLFKQLLERRPIDRQKLFGHFKELILCHRYGRYEAYANIYNNRNDTLPKAQAFDYAVRSAVYQYFAFFQIVQHFNLFSVMEEQEPDIAVIDDATVVDPSEYTQKVEAFFVRMKYEDSHKALFYLGRALNLIALVQSEKGYTSKPVMEKLNYSGMDKKAIRKLREDLADKARQFQLSKPENKKRNPEFSFGQFTKHFDEIGWSMNPEEALFFILSGYSFTTK